MTRRRFLGAGVAAPLLLQLDVAPAKVIELPSTTPGWGRGGGTRTVWVGGAASIPGTREQLEPDDNGIWVNKRTGERYTPFETPGAAGLGYIVIDVVRSDLAGLVLWQTNLLLHLEADGATTITDTNGMVALPDNVADFWVAPAALAELTEQSEADLRILRMPYKLGPRTFRAIGILSRSAEGVSQRFYDLDTGLCLATGSTTQSGPVLALGPGDTLQPGPGSTQLTFTKLAGSRHIVLPGYGEQYSRAMRRLRAMTYAGTKTVHVAGASTYSVPIDLNYGVLSNHGYYLRARVTGTGLTLPVERVIPPGVIGSLWMNPDILAGYRSGQVLDRDQITGVQSVVAGLRQDEITLALRTPLARHSFTYNQEDGVLVGADLQNKIGMVTDRVKLRLSGKR